MSLPAVFGTTVETVPWAGAYLGAEPEAVAGEAEAVPQRGDVDCGWGWRGRAIRATRRTGFGR